MHVGSLEYRGGYSVPWGDHGGRGGYHEYRGGKIFCYLRTPTVLMISPHMYHDIPHGTQITKDGTPQRY